MYVTRDSKQIKHIRSERITTADVEDRREPKFSSPDVLDLAREGELLRRLGVVVRERRALHGPFVLHGPRRLAYLRSSLSAQPLLPQFVAARSSTPSFHNDAEPVNGWRRYAILG